MVATESQEAVQESMADYVPLAIGTYEDARAMIGTSTPPTRSMVPIELGLVRTFAGLVEDANPCYWDPAVSEEIWGAQIAPHGLLRSMFCLPRWTPEKAVSVPAAFSRTVPLPGRSLINVESGQTFHRPLRVGDWITLTETLDDVSEAKNTRLGTGHFLYTSQRYTDDDGEEIATGYGRLLRFEPDGGQKEAQ